MKDFEDYLMLKHRQEFLGIDDDQAEAYEHWLADLDVDMLIDYANRYASLMVIESLKGMQKVIRGDVI